MPNVASPLTSAYIGGDIFVLHRDVSSASARSYRRSIHSTPMNLESGSALRPITANNEEASSSTSDIPPSPLLVVYSPSVSRHSSGHAHSPPRISDEEMDSAIDMQEASGSNLDTPLSPFLVVSAPAVSSHSSGHAHNLSKVSDDEMNLANSMQEAAGSTLDAPSSPLRVVYSPAVSRHSSGRALSPSKVSGGETNLANDMQPSGDSATAPMSEPLLSSGSHIYRRGRHNSTASGVEAGILAGDVHRRSRHNSNASDMEARISASDGATRTMAAQEMDYEEDQSALVFKALPETKWFRSITLAKIALAVVTCSVLGNFIYT